MTNYVELACTSNFSFLRGASHPEELVVQAAHLGLSGLSITDRNSLAGIVRGHMAAKEAGIAYVTGCRLVFAGTTPDILVWPRDRGAYGRLCELLTLGKRRTTKGNCELYLDDLFAKGEGLLMAVVPGRLDKTLQFCLAKLAEAFPDHVHIAIARNHNASDQRRMARLEKISRSMDIPLIAIGDVLYHHPARRPLQDVLTCVREHQTLQTIGTQLEPNAERHLRSPAEMHRLFEGYETAIENASNLFKSLRFSLDELRYQYPDEPLFEELNNKPVPSQEALERLTAIGLKKRYPDGASKKVMNAIAHETRLIAKLNYAPYFLTVYVPISSCCKKWNMPNAAAYS